MIQLPFIGENIGDGEHIAITGPAASGKSTLAAKIAGFYPTRVKYISFVDSYGFSSDRSYYLQQRWNSTEMDEEALTAGEVLESVAVTEDDYAEMNRLVDLFGIRGILGKDPVTFSSGELRKYQIAKALIKKPEVLLIDNPYIGLDPKTRRLLTDLLRSLSSGMTIILVLSRPEEIPDFITHVIVDGQKMPLKVYLDSIFSPEVIRFNKVTIRYGDRTILKDLDWTVRKGEHWVLTGENGCGKSTLLSLVCADNPMAYACDIEMFGKARGSGESIWEIKKRIGYVSPEMHRSYHRNQPGLEVVASGLFDTTGLIHHISQEQRDHCLGTMNKFGIGYLADREFNKMSSTQQRLCLVCRAFVKDCELLILDEPLHGLDNQWRRRVRDIIDEYCSDKSKTLIMVTHYPEEYPACIDHSLTLVKN